MRIHYNKLIRDRIPEIIAAAGKPFATQTMDEAEYLAALAGKLLEEAQEVQAALASGAAGELIKEIADVYEVLDALSRSQQLSAAAIRAIQAQRRDQRGAFAERLKLLWVDEPTPG